MCILCKEYSADVDHVTIFTCKKCTPFVHFGMNYKDNENISQEKARSEKIIESIKEKMKKSKQDEMEMKCKKYLLEHLKIEIDMQIFFFLEKKRVFQKNQILMDAVKKLKKCLTNLNVNCKTVLKIY